ncbi:hypothetical protein WQ57_11120 [Mesobacillus campisalis]|uniref:Uncharacterized protein n=1 Tax=Mesobacillus campisalis TaxID=1408103 RepID=A0A0M2SV32_9BACI|nr:hypothetical protein [Mesobacillus campisalis]KKK38028.1 hypothetical protein WQ57_11120 [Mesobacillus campisalis]
MITSIFSGIASIPWIIASIPEDIASIICFIRHTGVQIVTRRHYLPKWFDILPIKKDRRQFKRFACSVADQPKQLLSSYLFTKR